MPADVIHPGRAVNLVTSHSALAETPGGTWPSASASGRPTWRAAGSPTPRCSRRSPRCASRQAPLARGCITGAGSRTRTSACGPSTCGRSPCCNRDAATRPTSSPPPRPPPPPAAPTPDIESELTRIAATPASVVRQEIELSLSETPGAQDSELGRLLLGDPAEVLSFLTHLVRAAWRALVEPVWPRVRAVLEADIGYRSRRLAEGGLDRLFADLSQTLRWTGDTLVREPGGDEHVDLGGRGVLLMPSVFQWEEGTVITQPPWHPTISYPARGLGDLWQPVPPAPPAALERLV